MSSKIIPAEDSEEWQSWSLNTFETSGAKSLRGLRPEDLRARLAAAAAELEAKEQAELEAQAAAEAAAAEDEAAAAEAELTAGENEAVSVETVDIEPARIYPTAAEIEAIHQEAFQAGYEAGHKAGFETGQRLGLEQSELAVRAEFSPAFQSFVQVQEKVEESLKDLDKKLATTILDLALDCARRIVAQEIAVNEQVILGIIRQAVAALPEDMGQARLRLHPDDIATVQRYADGDSRTRSWTLIADPSIERGACDIETPTARLDLSLKQRWSQLCASLGVNGNVVQNR